MRNFIPIILCGLFLLFHTSCEDKSFKQHRSLVTAVRTFYDAVTAQNIEAIYTYFPDELKELYTRQEFVALLETQTKKEILGAFALLPLRRYKIDTIHRISEKMFEVTVIIYPQKMPPMKDIMKWELNNNSWENISYKNLVKNLIENYKEQQSRILSNIIAFKQCKNQLQHLALALWEYCSREGITMNKFESMPSNKWISTLQENTMFINNIVPTCPAGGEYSIEYDGKDEKFIFNCSQHPPISLPFRFPAFDKKGIE